MQIDEDDSDDAVAEELDREEDEDEDSDDERRPAARVPVVEQERRVFRVSSKDQVDIEEHIVTNGWDAIKPLFCQWDGSLASLYMRTADVSMWGTDGSRHLAKLHFDGEGKDKHLLPNHRANALIKAGRFATKSFFESVLVDEESRNQFLKEAHGPNYFVGDVVISSDNSLFCPDMRIFGASPIHFIVHDKMPCKEMEEKHGRDLASKMASALTMKKMPATGASQAQLLEFLEHPVWISVKYRVTPTRGFDEEYRGLLEKWAMNDLLDDLI